MVKFLSIGIGGGFGALLRYFISTFTYKFLDGIFPWGTLTVNLIGCFCIGFLWGIFERFVIAPNIRLFIFVGILGGFTTFSSYGLETFSLLREGESKMALLNVLSSNIFGIGCVFGGFAVSAEVLKVFNFK